MNHTDDIVQTFIANGGRIARRRGRGPYHKSDAQLAGTERIQDPRIITIAYTHDPETGCIRYGATIFRQDKPSDNFHRRSHNHTAVSRYTDYPVYVDQPFEFADAGEREDFIRECLMTFGCSSKGIKSKAENVPTAEQALGGLLNMLTDMGQ